MKFTTNQYPNKEGSAFVSFGLTGFGTRFVDSGLLRGYGYVRGGINGYTTPKVKLSLVLQSFRNLLCTGSTDAIVESAKTIKALTVSAVRDQVRISYKGATLYTARCED